MSIIVRQQMKIGNDIFNHDKLGDKLGSWYLKEWKMYTHNIYSTFILITMGANIWILINIFVIPFITYERTHNHFCQKEKRINHLLLWAHNHFRGSQQWSEV